VPAQTGAPLAVANWGQRCCARDIAELRTALAQLQTSGVQSQSPTTLARLGRRPSTGQINQRIGLITGALDAFANARDATVATAALNFIGNHVRALAAITAGNQ
jgi:hypothetical protein